MSRVIATEQHTAEFNFILLSSLLDSIETITTCLKGSDFQPAESS